MKKYASVAQSVEQGTENPRVGGSIPPGGTIFSMSAEALIEKIIPPAKESKAGSWKYAGGIFQPAWLLPQQKRFRPER